MGGGGWGTVIIGDFESEHRTTHDCNEYVPCISAENYNNVPGEGHGTAWCANKLYYKYLVRLSPVENFKSEIATFPPLFGSLQSVMHNSTGDSLTKYP